MLKIRDRSILQQLHQRLPVAVGRVEPGLNMFILQYHHAAIVSGGRDLSRWIVGDRREGVELRLTLRRPVRPEARDRHLTWRLRIEIQHDVLPLLSGPQRTVFVVMQCNVLVESGHHDYRMMRAEDLAPELL